MNPYLDKTLFQKMQKKNCSLRISFIPSFQAIGRYIPLLLGLFLSLFLTTLLPKELQSSEPSYDISEEEKLDPRMIVRLEKLANHNRGIISQLAIDARLVRKGPIEQEVKISDDGILTIKTSFALEQKEESNLISPQIPCTTTRSFSLSNFKDGGRFRYEMNRSLNAIVLYDGTKSHYLAFVSTSDFEQATTLFSILVEQSSRIHREKLTPISQHKINHDLPSKILHDAGFKWIAVIPRSENIDAMCNFFSQKYNENSDTAIIWATKSPASNEFEIKTLLEESRNLSPIFLFPLTRLDEWEFTTMPFIGATSDQPFTTPTQEQSILSEDRKSLKKISEVQSTIACKIMQEAPAFRKPSCIICRNRDEKQVKKGLHLLFSQEEEDSYKILTMFPHFFQEEIPEGSVCKWLNGISPQSDDLLRSLFFEPLSSSQEILTHIYREYPALSKILQETSRIRPKMSILESLFINIKELKYPEYLSRIDSNTETASYIIKNRRIALSIFAAVETGALFGSVEEFGKNGIQFALTLAEKLGACWKEKIAIEQFLIEKNRTLAPSSSIKKGAWLSTYIREKERSRDHHIPFKEWLVDHYIASQALSLALKEHPQFHFQEDTATQLISVLPQAFIDGSFTIPTGRGISQKIDHARPLFAVYLWEKMDIPFHRDGIALSRIRTKYEEYILKHPKSLWKNRFWEWVSHKQEKKEIKELASSIYVTDIEREKYRAHFENGILTAPKELINNEDEDIIFVVGLDGSLYLWKKYDAQSCTALSFNHASFFCGNPIASSGKMRVRNGKILLITDHSGHYRPKRKEMLIILKALQNHGVNIENMAVLHSASASKTKLWKSGNAFLQEYMTENELIANL